MGDSTRARKERREDDDLKMNSGRRGRPYLEWVEWVEENTSAEYEPRDDYSRWQSFQGTDQGGDQAGAPALPAAGAAGFAAAHAAFTKRHNRGWRFLCETQEDANLRTLLRTVPSGIIGGQGRARRAWLALALQCNEPMTDGEIADINTEFNLAGIKKTVGFGEGSITDFDRALSEIDVRLPAASRHAEHDICVKILQSIIADSPSEMSWDALKELQAQGAAIRYVHAGTVNRSRVAIVTAYDQEWRSLFKQSKIRKAPAGARSESSTTLLTLSGDALSPEQHALLADLPPVDYCHRALCMDVAPSSLDPAILTQAFVAMQAGEAHALKSTLGSDHYISRDDTFDNEHAFTADEWDAYVAGRRGMPFRRRGGFASDRNAPLRRQRVCRNCFEFSCNETTCTKPKRDINEVIEILEKVKVSISSSSPVNTNDRPHASIQQRQRDASPNGNRRPRPRPFGSRPNTPHGRVRIAEDDDDSDEIAELRVAEVFMMDVDGRAKTALQPERTSSRKKCKASSGSQHGGANSTVGAAPAPAPATDASVDGPRKPHYVKLIIYGVTEGQECELYTYRKLDDGLIDFFGVKCELYESVSEAAMRCVVSQLEPIDHSWLHPVNEGINLTPTGHYTLEMRVGGTVANVTLFCINIDDHHYTQRPISERMWEKIVPDSNAWQTGNHVYEHLMLQKRAFAYGLREALLADQMHPDVVPRSPRGFYSQPDGPEAGRFAAFTTIGPPAPPPSPLPDDVEDESDEVDVDVEFDSDASMDLMDILLIAGAPREPVVIQYDHDAMGVLFTYINSDMGSISGWISYARDTLKIHMSLRLTCRMLRDAVDAHGRAPLIANVGHWIAGRRIREQRMQIQMQQMQQSKTARIAQRWASLCWKFQVNEALFEWCESAKIPEQRLDLVNDRPLRLPPKLRLKIELIRFKYLRLTAYARRQKRMRMQGLSSMTRSPRKQHMASRAWNACRNRASDENSKTAWNKIPWYMECPRQRQPYRIAQAKKRSRMPRSDEMPSDGEFTLRDQEGDWLYHKKPRSTFYERVTGMRSPLPSTSESEPDIPLVSQKDTRDVPRLRRCACAAGVCQKWIRHDDHDQQCPGCRTCIYTSCPLKCTCNGCDCDHRWHSATKATPPTNEWTLPLRNQVVLPATYHGNLHSSGQVCMTGTGKRVAREASDDVWSEMIVDSGATRHIVTSVADLSEYMEINDPDSNVVVGNGAKLAVTHIGHAMIRVPVGHGKVQAMRLTHVLVVPEMTVCLFSTGWGWAYDGIESHFNGDTCLVLPNKQVVMFTDHPRHYSIVYKPSATHESHLTTAAACVVRVGHSAEAYTTGGDIVHRRLAHFSSKRLLASRQHAGGIDLDSVRDHDPDVCDGCLLNRRRPSFTRRSATDAGRERRASTFGELISSDLMQMPESRPHGYRYLMTFVDAACSYVTVRFLLDKSPEGVIDALRSFVTEFREHFNGRGPTKWRTDNGGEFISTDVDEFCAELATRHITVPSRSPQDNGGAERANGILLRQTRIVLAAANLIDELWPFACKYIAMVHNSLSTRALPSGISAYEFVKERKANLDIFHVFGCVCYVGLSKPDQDKFLKTSPTAVKAINLGYADDAKGYHVYIPELDRYTVVHPSKFIEDEYPTETVLNRSVLHTPKPKQARRKKDQARQLRPEEPEAAGDGNHIIYFTCGIGGEIYELDLSKLNGRDIPIPKSYEEAVDPSNPYSPYWIEAINEELTGKQQNGEQGTWTIVPREDMLREGRRAMKVKWVFTIKFNVDGSIEKFKARIVGCGYSQIEGVDYKETFASTIRGTTIRCFFAEAAAMDLELELVDVTKAFTQASVPERLYIELPKGATMDGMVGLLNQNLEGTKQGAHLWQNMLSEALIKRGFKRSEIDPNLYLLKHKGTIMLLIVWVDDMAVAHNNPHEFQKFFKEFRAEINSTTKKLDKFVGIEVTRDWNKHTITLKQAKYIEAIMTRHLSINASKAWKHITPCGTSRADTDKFMGLSDAKDEGEKAIVIGKGYLTILGGLLYAMCMTMPDIAYHCARLAVHMQAPSKEAYEALLYLLEYCYHRRDLGLTFGGTPRAGYTEFQETIGAAPEIHADASFGGREVAPFAGGFIRWRNGAVAWISRKVKFIPQSSCEAEVAALVAMCKEALFVASVLESMEVNIQKPLPAVTDSKSAYDIVRNPGVTKHTTHFARWLHLARRLQLMGHIQLYLERTERMMADDKTKALGDKTKVLQCRAFQLNSSG